MSSRVNRCLALAALVLPAVLLLGPAQAQLGRPGPGGRPGGVGGMPGGPPGNMPGGMQGGGIGGGAAGGMQGGMPGRPGGIGGIGGGLQDEWVCSGCGQVIGHGPIKPAWSRCPKCGAKFSDGPDGMDSGPPGAPAPGAPVNAAPPANGNAAPADSDPATRRTVLIGATIAVGVLIVLAIAGTGLYFVVSRNVKKNRVPRRRKRVFHDD
jgi:hypothetical protein